MSITSEDELAIVSLWTFKPGVGVLVHIGVFCFQASATIPCHIFRCSERDITSAVSFLLL